TLSEVVSGSVQIGNTNQSYTFKIQEDDMVVFLEWDTDAEDSVDMDIFFWIDIEGDTNDISIVNPQFVGGGTNVGYEFDYIILTAGLWPPDAEIGFSYVYWGGKSDNVPFTVTFSNYGGNLNGIVGDVEFEGLYHLDNIN